MKLHTNRVVVQATYTVYLLHRDRITDHFQLVMYYALYMLVCFAVVDWNETIFTTVWIIWIGYTASGE